MVKRLTRRALLAGATTLAGQAALAGVPSSILPPPPRGRATAELVRRAPVDAAEEIIAKSGLDGVVTFALIDTATGEVVEARQPGRMMPPASTLKSVTALYGLDRLGPGYRFITRVLHTGERIGGRITGDLILAGGGDPTLDTDRLADLAIRVRETGVTEVDGRLLIWAGALPGGQMIDDDQPDHVAYNPSFGGLNLNFNRVHFEWKRAGDGYDITMQARALRFRPATETARMMLVDRAAPVFEYRAAPGGGGDRWTVAEPALGRDGARWLPVRYPALYCGDVFRTLLRSNGIVLPAPVLMDAAPVGAALLAQDESPELNDILRGMMEYSTNLTAEAVGLTASHSHGVPAASLLASGARMAGWAETLHGARRLRFRDHSGLGYGSEIGAGDLAMILGSDQRARGFMSDVSIPEPGKSDGAAMAGVSAVAKTGTLNFVSALAGYVTTRTGRDLAFAILTADVTRRDAIPPEERERPPGARTWSGRSRRLQKALLARWASVV